ncbi:MAG: methyltransferase domain-containing protein [Nitrospiraceae bacterium]
MPERQEQLLNKITSCEVCGNHELEKVLDLGYHAMCDDLVRIGEQRKTEKYPIQILFCSNCKTAHQQYQVPKKIVFPRTYHYRAALTKDVLNGMRELVDSCESRFGRLTGKAVLDIGCNDGSLLSMFKEKGASTYGIEPTDAAVEARAKHHSVIQDYFSKELARSFVENNGKPDIITFTNVFAHIENLRDVLAALDVLMQNTTSCLVVENHYLGSVLDRNQFDTFYHEHPRTYSYTSFKFIAGSLNARITGLEFPRRYGGNIRVFLSHAPASAAGTIEEAEVLRRESLFSREFSRMATSMEAWRQRKRKELLGEIEKHGKLRAKAFPGRAAILLELLKLTEEHISAVYEQPPSPKVGCYVPGTGIPILSDKEFDVSNPAPIVNLAWHIQGEIVSYLAKSGFRGRVLPIVSEEDFMQTSAMGRAAV